MAGKMTYYEYGYKAGKLWAEQNRAASPADLGKEQDVRMGRMKVQGFPNEARQAWSKGFWQGASSILQ